VTFPLVDLSLLRNISPKDAKSPGDTSPPGKRRFFQGREFPETPCPIALFRRWSNGIFSPGDVVWLAWTAPGRRFGRGLVGFGPPVGHIAKLSFPFPYLIPLAAPRSAGSFPAREIMLSPWYALTFLHSVASRISRPPFPLIGDFPLLDLQPVMLCRSGAGSILLFSSGASPFLIV